MTSSLEKKLLRCDKRETQRKIATNIFFYWCCIGRSVYVLRAHFYNFHWESDAYIKQPLFRRKINLWCSKVRSEKILLRRKRMQNFKVHEKHSSCFLFVKFEFHCIIYKNQCICSASANRWSTWKFLYKLYSVFVCSSIAFQRERKKNWTNKNEWDLISFKWSKSISWVNFWDRSCCCARHSD